MSLSAQFIHDTAPLGSIIATSDGAPRPSARFTRMVKAWEHVNGSGRLIARTPAREIGRFTSPASFTLDHGAVAASGVVLVSFHRIYNVTSRLIFTIVERPPIGSVRVLSGAGDDPELQHLAEDRAAAERWCELNGYRQAVLEAVTADDLAADVVEGEGARMRKILSNAASMVGPDEGPDVVFGRTADGLLAARMGEDDAFAMVPCTSGEYSFVSAWRLRRPIPEWKRSDFYIHFGTVADEAAFRARVEEQAEHRRELKRLDRQTIASRVSTPWGISESATLHAEGIVRYTTPGHGGFHLSPERNADVMASLRRENGWYEEDCEWAIIALSFPEHFTAYERRCADETVRHYWPDEWEVLFGRILAPGESTVKDRRAFERRHADEWIVISAIQSDHAPGMMEVIATRG